MQSFPAAVAQEQHRTSWRIRWDYERLAGGRPTSNVPVIEEAAFRRSPDEEFIPIVSNLKVAELFTAYNCGPRLFDIGGSRPYELLPAMEKDISPGCAVPGEIVDQYLIREVVYDDIRWKRRGSVRHGQTLRLRATLEANNYFFILEYGFRDDGAIVCRVGLGGHNWGPVSSGREPHLHIPCWRFEPHLGHPDANRVRTVSIVQSSDAGRAALERVDFNNGVEGGIVIDPASFACLTIENSLSCNRHRPTPNSIAYDLYPMSPLHPRMHGAGEEFTHADCWVTRANPDSPDRTAPETLYREVANYAAHHESLAGHAIAIWHHAAVPHIPRDEDFGDFGYNPNNGVVQATWTGFELRPRNLFSKTPLYP